MGSMTARRCREIIAEIVDATTRAGDSNLHYLDGLELFGPDDVGDLPDGLAPERPRLRADRRALPEAAFGDGGPFAAA